VAQPKLPKGYQWWKGSIRVRIWVPVECRARLRALHRGKSELVKALDTRAVNVATDRGASWIAGYREMIRNAWPQPPVWEVFRPDWFDHPQFLMRPVGSTATVPAPMVDVTPALPAAYKFETLVDECAADRGGWPADRVKVIKSTFKKLAKFLGHDDARKVTLPELSSFKTSLLNSPRKRGGKISRNSVKQLLSPIKVGFRWAAANGKLDSDPAATLSVENVVVGTRADMTGDETATILTSARKIADEQRWFVWLMAATGASNKELYSCISDDFSLQGETIVWALHGSKTASRERTIPLPSYVAKEGFWKFVQSRQPGQKLFTDRVDKKVNDWIKTLPSANGGKIAKTVYSLRHRLETLLRNPKLHIDPDLQRYYLGHAASGDVHSTYGENPTPYLVEIIERVPAPV
jgi:integrase